MAPKKKYAPCKSLQQLDDLLKKNKIRLRQTPKPPAPTGPGIVESTARRTSDSSPEEERRLFLEAMSDVCPLAAPRNRFHPTPEKNRSFRPCDPEQEAMNRLNNLIRTGRGFVVSLTPEYVEGIAANTHPEIARRLHQGEFSIQDHIDLHGCNVVEARDELDHFLKTSIAARKRAVLIVHGRGLSSPGRPVLKKSVIAWLTSGRWKKWVIAFTSARRCDGGVGATYVLLRSQPVPRRHRKNNQIRRQS